MELNINIVLNEILITFDIEIILIEELDKRFIHVFNRYRMLHAVRIKGVFEDVKHE